MTSCIFFRGLEKASEPVLPDVNSNHQIPLPNQGQSRQIALLESHPKPVHRDGWNFKRPAEGLKINRI